MTILNSCKTTLLVLLMSVLLPFMGNAQATEAKKAVEPKTAVTPPVKVVKKDTSAAVEAGAVTPKLNPEEPPYLTTKEVKLSYAVLIFAILVIGMVLFTFVQKSDVIEKSDLAKIITTVVIITSVLFLITCGYSATQIQPAFGLLGALAGYALGQQSAKGG